MPRLVAPFDGLAHLSFVRMRLLGLLNLNPSRACSLRECFFHGELTCGQVTGAGSDDHRRVFRYWRGVGPGARLPITGNVTGDGDPERPVDLARSHGPCSPRSSNPGARHPHGCWLPRRKRPVRSSRPPTAPQAQPTSSRAGLLRQLSRRTGQALPVASAKAQALSSQRAALVL